MVSVISDRNGFERFPFFDGNGKRRPLRLGNIDKKKARKICGFVEDNLAAVLSGRG